MKEHSSHDVVLLCAGCHQLSNMRDQAVRERLAAECDAPLTPHPHAKLWEDAECKFDHFLFIQSNCVNSSACWLSTK